jgi:hypothetical protein
VYGLEDLVVVGEVELAGQMGGSNQDGLARGQGEAANGDAMILDDGSEEVRVEAGEEDEVSAVAGRVMVVGGVGVELLQQLRRRDAALSEDDDVGVFLAGEVVNEAGDVVLVEVPEEEALRGRQLSVVSCKLSV